MTTLSRASWRHLTHHPWQSVLAVVGIAVGVAVVIAIDLAGASSQRAFEISAEQVTGRATHRIVGGPDGLPEEVYRQLRVEMGGLPAAPIVEARVAVERATAEGGRRTLQLLGVDPLAERPFRNHIGSTTATETNALGRRLIAEPGAAALSAATAHRLAVSVDDTLRLIIDDRRPTVTLVATLSSTNEAASASLDDLVVVDIATAQELLGRPGVLSRIDLIVDADEPDRQLEGLTAVLPPSARVIRSAARTRSADNMTAAFRINLRALSLLALVCGGFLIYNTMTFSVVQRRPVIGILRALGVTRGQIFRIVLLEALLVGTLGSALGCALGVFLARGLVEAVVQTVNDLYFAVQVTGVVLDPILLGRGLLLGAGAAVAAALRPALEASRAQPSVALARSTIEERSRQRAPWAAALGTAAIGCGYLMLSLGSRSLELSFIALFVILLGWSLWTPLVSLAFAGVLDRALRAAGFVPRLAAGSLGRNLSRTAVAVAALAMAVAVSIGIGLMIRSFRSTVESWLEFSLPADLYVTLERPEDSRLDDGGTFSAATIDGLKRLGGVARVNTLLHQEVELDEPIQLIAIDIDERSYSAFRFKEGNEGAAWTRFQRGDAIIVSEPFAERTGLGVGDSVRLPGRSGDRELPVAAVFYDYSSDRGMVMISRRAYADLWDDPRVTAVSIFLTDPFDVAAATERVRDLLGDDVQFAVRSNATLREESLAIFDRTFLVTRILRLLVTLVAFVGVLSALMALVLERTREVGILRALGLTRGQIWGLVTTETGLLGATAAILAAPLGLATAWLMIYVINRRSFGWTMPLQIDPTVFAQAALLALVPALLAGLLPAWRMSQTPASEALRDE